MYKIAILGTENSHADAFANIIYKGHRNLGNVPYSDFEIVGICGDDAEKNKKMQETFGIAEISDNPEAWVGKVDGIMVTARHGGKHLKYAKKYIENGTPAFIDKPITISENEALELARLAKSKNVPLCGGSTLGVADDVVYMRDLFNDSERCKKVYGGAVSAPINMKNEWGDFFFYSQHLVQIMTGIFGSGIESVIARGREDSATFIARYKDFDVSGHYGSHAYSATIYEQSKVFHKEIDIFADRYLREFERFEHMLRTGRMLEDYDEFIKPVFILNAIYESLKTGAEVSVRKFEI